MWNDSTTLLAVNRLVVMTDFFTDERRTNMVEFSLCVIALVVLIKELKG